MSESHYIPVPKRLQKLMFTFDMSEWWRHDSIWTKHNRLYPEKRKKRMRP